ncbi:hypothetical protein [Arthrobacter sp. PAMC 25486]|uniref:hypothetical protein n=1 Tax=Arthrobacter sp. PAMC 25486 TaxID=1494608 RepID=UPI00138DE383|nr:hypothetical protein [Arthrobacter sp. PAMC 25486]
MSMLHRRSTRTSAAFAGVAVLALLVMTGCSPAESESAKDYKALNPDFRMEQAHLQVSCMKDKGFTVLPDSQGGVKFGNEQVPEDQLDLAYQGIRDCYDELGFNDEPEITEAQRHKLYVLNIEAAKCLEALDIFGDIKVQVADAPSEQSFVESFDAPGENQPWSPWGLDTMKQLSSAGETIVDEARLACPDPLNYANTL